MLEARSSVPSDRISGEKVLAALRSLSDDRKLEVIRNEHWRSGRASSVNTAIGALPDDARGAVFLQGDMPLMTHHLIDLVVKEFVKSGVRICFLLHKGGKGHPVAFSRELLAELQGLCGDQSGFALARKHWDEALKLPLDDELTQFDLDTNKDYLRLLDLE